MYADPGPLPLRRDLPFSVALGAGGMRGLAHVGALEVLLRDGFSIGEMIGTSVGALIAACYASVGLTLEEMTAAGLRLRSHQLLAWAVVRGRAPWVRRLASPVLGSIPHYLERIRTARFTPGQAGVARVGVLTLDVVTGQPLLCHSDDPVVTLEDAVRGAVAVPGVFPPRRCRSGTRELGLMDAGQVNGLPVDLLFEPPFQARQVVAIDISRCTADRERNQRKIEALRARHPDTPIAALYPASIGEATLVYSATRPRLLLAAGREAAQWLLDQCGARHTTVVAAAPSAAARLPEGSGVSLT
jgi:NTE family protein